ncbi:hypothetical protein PENSTE_c018G00776 [Penicillium steckii]|uniref:Uncharacterized protein n=1 Tax=Penicillium steckii TaxID=303698 RepID=A0A1V6SWM7_9EURO|nr:hypothetical protein PENSTE_c018G00776 [Penicillium steckii]
MCAITQLDRDTSIFVSPGHRLYITATINAHAKCLSTLDRIPTTLGTKGLDKFDNLTTNVTIGLFTVPPSFIKLAMQNGQKIDLQDQRSDGSSPRSKLRREYDQSLESVPSITKKYTHLRPMKQGDKTPDIV